MLVVVVVSVSLNGIVNYSWFFLLKFPFSLKYRVWTFWTFVRLCVCEYGLKAAAFRFAIRRFTVGLFEIWLMLVLKFELLAALNCLCSSGCLRGCVSFLQGNPRKREGLIVFLLTQSTWAISSVKNWKFNFCKIVLILKRKLTSAFGRVVVLILF